MVHHIDHYPATEMLHFLNHLSVEFRKQLLDTMTESLRTAIDPGDIKALEIGIENLKKSLS